MEPKERHVIIMAGGIGSRIWPMSTPECPKQFIDVMGIGKTLLQLTAARFESICPIENFWVVTSERYVDFVKQQLPNVPVENILSEPVGRNTAPCIGYACWKIKKKYPKANIVVTPSDALVIDTAEFSRVIKEACEFTARQRVIVTVGIEPNRPETGYGYICAENGKENQEILKVDAFKEKPDLATACEYIKSKNYLWNAGIFVWNLGTIIAEFQKYVPELAAIMDNMADSFYTENEQETVKKWFPQCEKISIDYAVMEKSKDIYTIPAHFGWSDLGSWGSLKKILPSDDNRNAIIGNNVVLHECHDCMVHVNAERNVVLDGLDGYIVSEHDGRLLVCRLPEEQKIKEFCFHT